MSDQDTYPVSGNLEFKVEQAFIDVLKYDDTIAAVFGSHEDVNIRRTKDKSKGDRALPSMAVEFIIDQSLRDSNEYHGRGRIYCVTQADDDADGQMGDALVGAVRDCLHKESTPEYDGHFDGDCKGFLEALNNTTRGVVFHQVHEQDTEPDDDGRVRRQIVNVDAWLYPGRAS